MRITEIENICIFIVNEVERITQFECEVDIQDFYITFTATKCEYNICCKVERTLINAKGCNMSSTVIDTLKENFLTEFFYCGCKVKNCSTYCTES